MIRIEQIKKVYDPRIPQIIQQSFVPFHVQFASQAFQRIKYSDFLMKNKKKCSFLSPASFLQPGYKGRAKASKGHEVAPESAASSTCPYRCTKAFQTINFFSETEKEELNFQQYQKLVVLKSMEGNLNKN